MCMSVGILDSSEHRVCTCASYKPAAFFQCIVKYEFLNRNCVHAYCDTVTTLLTIISQTNFFLSIYIQCNCN